MELTRPLPRYLRRLREERRLTISGLSQRCGTSPAAGGAKALLPHPAGGKEEIVVTVRKSVS